MRTASQPIPETPDRTAVVSKALVRSSELLGLTAKELAHIVGLSEPSISRLKRSLDGAPLSGKSYELALLFIRLYRSLDAIVGGDDAVARTWMRTDNTMLGGKPLNRIKTIDGLTHVLAYLDARRAPI
ncbi:MAG: MbcA/ParS/Xre antitoxin family protein [Phyllobacterium sp.]|uniref:MbcA/ParS/Xre antitoxin family protein n=1 Tax=Phyllobacterium sp. TaxID=1871046 RepID=UPI0030F19707